MIIAADGDGEVRNRQTGGAATPWHGWLLPKMTSHTHVVFD